MIALQGSTSNESPLLLVAGPTAIGKSAMAVRLAKALGGEVVSADTVQLYKGFDIGSAKPSEAERQGVVHHCIDILEPHDRCDVGRYLGFATDAIKAIQSRGKLPVVVAASGMYLTALVHGLVAAPAADHEFRASVEGLTNEVLHAELAARDPATAARLHAADRVRVVRALEVHHQGHQSMSGLQSLHGYPVVLRQALIIALEMERTSLYERIATRTRTMLRAGLLEETRRLRDAYPHAWALTSIGYRECCLALDGALPEEALEESITQATRRLAKRQRTYLRNEPGKRGWVTEKDVGSCSDGVPALEEIVGRISYRLLQSFHAPVLWRVPTESGVSGCSNSAPSGAV